MMALEKIKSEGVNPQKHNELDTYIKVKQDTDRDSDYTNARSIIVDNTDVYSISKYEKESLNIIKSLIDIFDPLWRKHLVRRRQQLYSYLKENRLIDVEQLFEYCDLFSHTDTEVSIWWKDFFQENYLESPSNTASGIEGETRTIEYENRILKKIGIEGKGECRNMSLEDPAAGFDVLSWRIDRDGKEYEIFIEAKNDSDGDSIFYLTKNEYKKSQKEKDRYSIYFWKDENQEEPFRLDWNYTRKNTPKDKGKGSWTNVKILPEEGDQDITWDKDWKEI